mmetsp:Transcript_66719/g.169083  ORF Transcript_66719/g.169083 Transcript_66719/m.169083 type:complete len:215 (+) Transcript_66719:1064-1708(+)
MYGMMRSSTAASTALCKSTVNPPVQWPRLFKTTTGVLTGFVEPSASCSKAVHWTALRTASTSSPARAPRKMRSSLAPGRPGALQCSPAPAAAGGRTSRTISGRPRHEPSERLGPVCPSLSDDSLRAAARAEPDACRRPRTPTTTDDDVDAPGHAVHDVAVPMSTAPAATAAAKAANADAGRERGGPTRRCCVRRCMACRCGRSRCRAVTEQKTT